MSNQRVKLHPLLRKAETDALALSTQIRIDSAGTIWRNSPDQGWKRNEDKLTDPRDREDFLVGQLSQEDR